MMNTQTQEALKMAIEALEWAVSNAKIIRDFPKDDVAKYANKTIGVCEDKIQACKEALAQPAQEPVETEPRYYIRNKDGGFLGNSPIWWAKGGCGYTAYILGAERFTEEGAKRIVNDAPDKFEMYKCADVDARLHLVFDEQDFKRLGTDEPCGWKSGYATHPAPSWQGLDEYRHLKWCVEQYRDCVGFELKSSKFQSVCEALEEVDAIEQALKEKTNVSIRACMVFNHGYGVGKD